MILTKLHNNTYTMVIYIIIGENIDKINFMINNDSAHPRAHPKSHDLFKLAIEPVVCTVATYARNNWTDRQIKLMSLQTTFSHSCIQVYDAHNDKYTMRIYKVFTINIVII